MTRWYEIAQRWADRCILCGEDNQRIVTFSMCMNCRKKEYEKKQKDKDSKKS